MSGVHRYLVTAPVDLKMDAWDATCTFANWIEGRALADGRETWLVTVFDRDSESFLTVARTFGVTVEQIQGGGESEGYDLAVGEPGSGWQDTSNAPQSVRETESPMPEPIAVPGVRVGQVWQAKDPKQKLPYLHVTASDFRYARGQLTAAVDDEGGRHTSVELVALPERYRLVSECRGPAAGRHEAIEETQHG